MAQRNTSSAASLVAASALDQPHAPATSSRKSTSQPVDCGLDPAGPTPSSGAERIDPTRRADIEAHLSAIEARHGVRILYACESGSRAWGFSSADSDYDVRFLYVHAPEGYLRVTPGRDVIEVPIANDLDINGWELKKTLALLKKGNATVNEWLGSPIVYREEEKFCTDLRTAAQLVHAPERAHYRYVHMARGQGAHHLQGEKVKLKKVLYALRPILAALWVEQGKGPPPVLFMDLVDGIVDDPLLRASILEMVRRKRDSREADFESPPAPVMAFIHRHLKRLLDLQPPKSTHIDFDPLDQLCAQTVLD